MRPLCRERKETFHRLISEGQSYTCFWRCIFVP